MLSPTTEEFMIGFTRMPCNIALAMKGRNVSLTPLRASHALRFFSRNRAMRVISILKIECTCALVRLDSTMRSAIFLRIGVMGTDSPGIVWIAGGADGRGDGWV